MGASAEGASSATCFPGELPKSYEFLKGHIRLRSPRGQLANWNLEVGKGGGGSSSPRVAQQEGVPGENQHYMQPGLVEAEASLPRQVEDEKVQCILIELF